MLTRAINHERKIGHETSSRYTHYEEWRERRIRFGDLIYVPRAICRVAQWAACDFSGEEAGASVCIYPRMYNAHAHTHTGSDLSQRSC